MKKEQIEQFFLLFSDLPQLGVYSALTDSASKRVLNSLKNKMISEEDEEKLSLYAASLAYYQYILLQAGKETEDISLDNMQIRSHSLEQVEIAKQIVVEFEQAVAHLIDKNNFCFLGVKE